MLEVKNLPGSGTPDFFCCSNEAEGIHFVEMGFIKRYNKITGQLLVNLSGSGCVGGDIYDILGCHITANFKSEITFSLARSHLAGPGGSATLVRLRAVWTNTDTFGVTSFIYERHVWESPDDGRIDCLNLDYELPYAGKVGVALPCPNNAPYFGEPIGSVVHVTSV